MRIYPMLFLVLLPLLLNAQIQKQDIESMLSFQGEFLFFYNDGSKTQPSGFLYFEGGVLCVKQGGRKIDIDTLKYIPPRYVDDSNRHKLIRKEFKVSIPHDKAGLIVMDSTKHREDSGFFPEEKKFRIHHYDTSTVTRTLIRYLPKPEYQNDPELKYYLQYLPKIKALSKPEFYWISEAEFINRGNVLSQENIEYIHFPEGYYNYEIPVYGASPDITVREVSIAFWDLGYSRTIVSQLNSELKAAITQFQKDNGLPSHCFPFAESWKYIMED